MVKIRRAAMRAGKPVCVYIREQTLIPLPDDRFDVGTLHELMRIGNYLKRMHEENDREGFNDACDQLRSILRRLREMA